MQYKIYFNYSTRSLAPTNHSLLWDYTHSLSVLAGDSLFTNSTYYIDYWIASE